MSHLDLVLKHRIDHEVSFIIDAVLDFSVRGEFFSRPICTFFELFWLI